MLTVDYLSPYKLLQEVLISILSNSALMRLTVKGESLWYLIVRYALGLIMLAYGWIKILGLQFILPDAIYEYQLKDLDGVTLTWAFLGFSRWFSTLLGLAEFIPAFLLLFRKTKVIGAILLPALLAIFLINNAYGFLPHMRIFTGVLLMMDLLLISAYYKEIRKFLETILQKQPTTKSVELIINTSLVLLVTLLIAFNLK